MKEKIRVITKRVGQPPRVVWMSNTLEAFQKAVGGYIETVSLMSDLVIVCDEEGRINDKHYNCSFANIPFFGDIIVVNVFRDKFCSVGTDLYRILKSCVPEWWHK